MTRLLQRKLLILTNGFLNSYFSLTHETHQLSLSISLFLSLSLSLSFSLLIYTGHHYIYSLLSSFLSYHYCFHCYWLLLIICCFTASLCIICSPRRNFRSTIQRIQTRHCAFCTIRTCVDHSPIARNKEIRKGNEKRWRACRGEWTHVDERTKQMKHETPHLF